MSALSLSSPFPIFTDIDGNPLEDGYIYIGTAGLNPETNPISVYWDAALTVPAAQPIRTLGGYPSRSGAAARIYVNVGDCSTLIKNKNGSLIFSALNQTKRISSSLVTFLQTGAGAVATTAQAKLQESVSVKDFGAVGDGVTDDTAAINLAIATGKDVRWPAGTYMTTGGHRLSTNRQRMLGADGVTIKRLSGTNYLLDTTHSAEVIMDNFVMDGNALAGSLIIWRGHYSKLSRIRFKNSITNYPLRVSAVNVSKFEDLDFGDTCYGGILFDQVTDPYFTDPGLPNDPAYTCLYSTFDKLIVGNTSGGRSIYFAGAGTTCIALNFNDCMLETPLLLDAQLQKSIIFNNLMGEYITLTETYCSVSGNESVNIQFNGGYLVSNAENSAHKVFDFNTLCRNVSVRNMYFGENPNTPSMAGRTLIEIAAVRNGVFENNVFQFINNFVFMIHDTGSASSYITDRSNIVATDATYTGTGASTYIGVDHLVLEHSNLTNTLTNCMYVNDTTANESGTFSLALLSGSCTGTANYVRQGKLCHVYGVISWATDGSGTTGITLTDLPFLSKNTAQYGFASHSGIALDSGDTYAGCKVGAASTNLTFMGWPGGSGIDASRWRTGAFMTFNIVYEVA